MRRHLKLLIVTTALLAMAAATASAGLVGFAIGGYGGLNSSLEEDGSNGSIIGARVRVMPPIPMIAVEGWFAHFGYDEPGPLDELNDIGLLIESEGFDLWGINALVGSVGGGPGLKLYGIVGVNAAEFEEFGKPESTRKLGGEAGVAVEFTPPAIGLGVEARGTIMVPDIKGDFDEKLFTVTAGINYYF